jgi:hypothetical protein
MYAAPETVRERMAYFLDGDPFDMSDELALLRLLLEAALNRYDGGADSADTEALLVELVNQIGRQVERMSKIRSRDALTRGEFALLAARATDIINRYIDDPERRAAFLHDLFGGVVPHAPLPTGDGETLIDG